MIFGKFILRQDLADLYTAKWLIHRMPGTTRKPVGVSGLTYVRLLNLECLLKKPYLGPADLPFHRKKLWDLTFRKKGGV